MLKIYVITLLAVFCMEPLSAMSSRNHVISKPTDLGGQIIVLPIEHKLVFKGEGCLYNGTIVGNNCQVSAPKRMIFKNIVLKGTFTAETAYSEWFDIKDDCVLDEEQRYISGTDNLLGFQNLFLFENVLIAPGSYYIPGSLNTISNQTIDGQGATLKWKFDKQVASFILVGGYGKNTYVENVTIKNLNIIGNKLETEKVTEYAHGIRICYAHNVLVENVTSTLNLGDGAVVSIGESFDIHPEDIHFNYFSSQKNHRQGLSITDGKNILVENSQFIETSGTLPYSGIDIEPNFYKGKAGNGKDAFNKCENIQIRNCIFRDNKSVGLIISASSYQSEATKEMIHDVKVEGCLFLNDGIWIIGGDLITIRDCTIKNGGIEMDAKGMINSVTLSNIIVDCEGDNYISGVHFAPLGPACRNISMNNLTIRGCNLGIYVSRGASVNGKTPIKLDGLSITNCKVYNCTNSIFITETAKNVYYEGNEVFDNGVDVNGRKLKSRFGHNIEFYKLDDKASRTDKDKNR